MVQAEETMRLRETIARSLVYLSGGSFRDFGISASEKVLERAAFPLFRSQMSMFAELGRRGSDESFMGSQLERMLYRLFALGIK